MKDSLTRREFCSALGKSYIAAASLGSFQLVNLTFGAEKPVQFTFAYISDSHLIVKKDYTKEHRFVKALKKAVEDVNDLEPQPDFVLFGGDLAQLGLAEELEMGKSILSGLKTKIYMMVGEHDWYYDMGEKWREFFGKDTYSFDHKGIHFIVLNSVIVEDYWTQAAMTPMERMLFMAQLDNPKGRPFTVGKEQINWLKDDLSKVNKSTPVVVFSHSPLYKYYRPWNFWTEDAEEVQKLLYPFKNVTVLHGHTHQVLTNRIKNIVFHGMVSTAWPWPYAPEGLPKLTGQMARTDPFNQLDGCGWGSLEMTGGKADKTYRLWDRNPMVITYETVTSGKVEQPDVAHSGPAY